MIVGDTPLTQPRGSLQVEPASFILTEGESISLKAKLGSTVVGASQVTWSVSPGDVATVDNFGFLTATKHGEATVTARYSSLEGTSEATVWAIPHRIEAVTSPTAAGIVGRSLSDSVGVRAVSKDGVPVPGVAVAFQVLSGEGTLSHATATTGNDGVASVDWVLGTHAGPQQIKAEAGALGEVLLGIDALPDYDSATVEGLSGDEQEAVVATYLPEALGARVTDQFGNPLPGLLMEWSFSHGGGASGAAGEGTGALPVVTSVTDAQGLTQVFWQLGTVAGEQEAFCGPPETGSSGVSGSLGGPGPEGAPKPGKARGRKWLAMAQPSDPDSLAVSPQETWTVVGVEETLSAKVMDPYGNVIEGASFQWGDDGSGIVEVNPGGKVKPLKLGRAEVLVSAPALNLNGSAWVNVEGRKASALVRNSGNGQKAPVAQPLPSPIAVLVRDQVGSPVAGVEVQWSSTGIGLSAPGGTGPSPSSSVGGPGALVTLTDEFGIAQNTWTMGTSAGQHSLQASVDGLSPVEFTAEADPGEPTYIDIDPKSATIDVGQTQQFLVTAQDAFHNDITELPTWTVATPSVAEVTPNGLATAMGEGSTTITAHLGDLSAVATLVAEALVPLVASVTLTPSSKVMQVGQTQAFTAEARDTEGNPVPGVSFEWTSSNEETVSISGSGFATAESTGFSEIRAEAFGVFGLAGVIVSDPGEPETPGEIVAVMVSPSSAGIQVGEARQFSATAIDAQGDPVLGASISWTSADGSVATVSSTGLATGVSEGLAEIQAEADGGATGIAELTVSAPPSEPEDEDVVVTVSPSSVTMTYLGEVVELSATVTDALDNPLSGVNIEWSSLDPSVVTVDQDGRMTSQAVGTALVVAAALCCQSADTLPVEVVPTPSQVVVTPSTVSLDVGQTQQLTAVVKDAGGSVITGTSVIWSSVDPGIAGVNPSSGLASGISEGSTQVRASVGAIQGSAFLTVNDTVTQGGGGGTPVAALPDLPRLLPDTSMPALTNTVEVANNLQAALDAASSGTRLILQGEHVGNFYVRNGSGVQIQGGRITTPNNMAAITFQSSASRWKMVGTEVRSSATTTSTLVAIDDADRITLQNVDVYGHDNLSIKRCVMGNGTHISVLNSSLTGCHIKGYDSQAFVAWNGAGPYWLEGNILEGAGENIMFGGADSESAAHLPADITVRNNTVRKPPEWFTSGAWSVKNLFEIKTAVRVLVENNTFENSWPDAQYVGINIKSVNQSGGEVGAWSKATDITFRGNIIRNIPTAISLAAAPQPPVAEVLTRVLIEDNLFENGGNDNPYGGGTAPRAILILGGIKNLTIRHNEWYGGYRNQVVFESGVKTDFIFENNIMDQATYGFQNAANLGSMAPGAVVTGNILAPAAWNTSLPSGNCITWPPSTATACPAAGRR